MSYATYDQAFNGSAVVRFADSEDSSARQQVEALLTPEQQARLQLPIQPTGAPVKPGDQQVLGIPQFDMYAGDLHADPGIDLRGNRVRISSPAFVGMTASASMHALRLGLCAVADNEPMEDAPSSDRSRFLRHCQFLQRSVTKPDSYRQRACYEAADCDYITVMLPSSEGASALAGATAHAPVVGHLPIQVTVSKRVPRPPRELELHFNIKIAILSFRAEDESSADRTDRNRLQPAAFEQKALLVALVKWGEQQQPPVDIQLYGEAVSDCFTFIGGPRAAIAFRTVAHKQAFLQHHKDQGMGTASFTTNMEAQVQALLTEDEKRFVDPPAEDPPQPPNRPGPAPPRGNAAGARNNSAAHHRRDRAKRHRVTLTLEQLGI